MILCHMQHMAATCLTLAAKAKATDRNRKREREGEFQRVRQGQMHFTLNEIPRYVYNVAYA